MVLILCSNHTILEAQTTFDINFCATEDSGEPSPTEFYSRSTDINYLKSFDPVVINVFYWRVNDEFGNSSNPITEDDALASIAHLNMEFNDINIFFKYRGIGELNSPPEVPLRVFDPNEPDPCAIHTDAAGNTLYDPEGYSRLDRCEIGSFSSYFTNNGFRLDDALNIYVPANTNFFGGVSHGSPSNAITMPPVNLTRDVMIHEVGHAFNLRHIGFGSNNSNCEHVTRDPNDDSFNADTAGDEVVDTAAVPSFFYEFCDEDPNDEFPRSYCLANVEARYFYLDPNTCEYIGAGTDCQDPPVEYVISAEDVQNIMADALPNNCVNSLTTGQGIRMQEAIQSESILQGIQTTIASLYEPYFGEYYFAGPQTNSPPLFQPGFEYVFYACDGDYPQPADFEDTSFTFETPFLYSIPPDVIDYRTITHPNGTAFVIKHPALTGPRMCYDNTNRNPLSGTVIKFRDNVFNNNIDIIPKDSLGINAQNLIQDLPEGLYKVEKHYENGEQEETVIIKENN